MKQHEELSVDGIGAGAIGGDLYDFGSPINSDDPESLLGPGNYRRIARTAGVTPQHVARVLRGERGASLHVGARIAKAAGVTLDQMYEFISNSPTLEIKGRHTRAAARTTRKK